LEATEEAVDRVTDAAGHYERLLAEHYVWMFGISFEEKVAEQKMLLDRVLSCAREGLAIDLGSGPGFQSVALAQLGFAPVIAVDTSKHLLAELEARSAPHAIESREADIASLDSIATNESASVIVCMGDTLTHLPAKTSVQALFGNIYAKLRAGGLFVLTYRDLTSELFGSDRFIPVRADDSRIMTCFLEFKTKETVAVHDLVYVQQKNGWTLHKSSYEKLRLAAQWVISSLGEAGFTVEEEEPAGRLRMVMARKQA
jgi:SAM-dependent methyltransferase